jgi:hypothetical protein
VVRVVCRSWNELEVSAVMELNLLRWETEIQMELGRSLLNLLKSLRDAVAEVQEAIMPHTVP